MGWKAHVDDSKTFVRNEVEVRVANMLPGGDYEIVTDWGSTTGVMTYERVTQSLLGNKPTEDAPLVLHEDLARAVMEALQRHFGAYAGVDYERLRKDYDRVVAENTANNIFIRDTLKTIIEARKPRT